jgi:glucokinase
MPGSLAVGVDVGGTKVAALLTGDQGTVLDRKLAHSPASDAEATVATVVSLARDLAAAHDGVIAVGIGAAGLVSREGVMRFAPNIAWREFPIGDRVADGVGLPVLVDNDANVAAWGEFKYGAGRGTNHLLLVTVGTGIGGGIVADGSLYRGAHGFAAEIGHIIVDPGGPVCGCGNVGCWEQVASGRAIERLGRKTAAENPDSVLGRAAGGNPSTIDGPTVTKAAEEGDPMSLRILEIVGVRLGEGIAGLVNVLDPDVVVVGGGASSAGDLLLEPARRAFVGAVEAPEHRPEVPILPAALGNDAGAIGAADLALAAALGSAG